MFCSPQLRAPRTWIPAGLRNALGSLLGGPPRGKNPADRAVCLFALGQIGDAVLALSALRRLVAHHGPENCVLVVSPLAGALIRRELPGVETVVLPADAPSLTRDILPLRWREREKFAAHRFARRVCLNHQRSLYHEVALSWIPAREDFRLRPETYPAPNPDTCTELLGHRRLVELVLGHPVDLAEVLPRFRQPAAGDDGRLLVYPLSHDGSRSVPAGRIVAILRHWRARSAAPIVLGGSPRDLGPLEDCAAAARAAGVKGITVEAPAGLDAFIAHLAAAGAVLSADSAAGQIGAALDKPTVVLTPPDWYGLCQPWRKSARQTTLRLDAPDADIAAALPDLPAR